MLWHMIFSTIVSKQLVYDFITKEEHFHLESLCVQRTYLEIRPWSQSVALRPAVCWTWACPSCWPPSHTLEQGEWWNDAFFCMSAMNGSYHAKYQQCRCERKQVNVTLQMIYSARGKMADVVTTLGAHLRKRPPFMLKFGVLKHWSSYCGSIWRLSTLVEE